MRIARAICKKGKYFVFKILKTEGINNNRKL